MPTNHDETLQQRYIREQAEHLAVLDKRTPEEIAHMEQLLHNALAERDQLETKVADTELALFAENQKRADVERERDQLQQRTDRAERALIGTGWTYTEGAAEWKPPVGPSASPILERIDQLQEERDQLLDLQAKTGDDLAATIRARAEKGGV